jgi:hypothetical protein
MRTQCEKSGLRAEDEGDVGDQCGLGSGASPSRAIDVESPELANLGYLLVLILLDGRFGPNTEN